MEEIGTTNPKYIYSTCHCEFYGAHARKTILLAPIHPPFTRQIVPLAGADPGFFKGGLKAMVICINYIIYILQLFTLLF